MIVLALIAMDQLKSQALSSHKESGRVQAFIDRSKAIIGNLGPNQKFDAGLASRGRQNLPSLLESKSAYLRNDAFTAVQ